MKSRRPHRRQVHAPSLPSPVAYVASLSGCSPSRHRGRRLLRRTYPDVSPALRLRDTPPRPPRTPPHRRHRPAHRRVGGSTDRPRGPGRDRPRLPAPRSRAIYGADFQRRVERMGIRQVIIAPRAPWQNPFTERVIGSIRRECLDLVIVLNERHLRRLFRYLVYYNVARPHQSLGNDSPRRREVQSVPSGRIVTVPRSAGFITATNARPDRPRSPTARSTAIIRPGRSVRVDTVIWRCSRCRRPCRFRREPSRSLYETLRRHGSPFRPGQRVQGAKPPSSVSAGSGPRRRPRGSGARRRDPDGRARP